MTVKVRSLAFAFAATVSISYAQAQTAGTVPLTNMNFDMWCQEERHLPPDRCDKRLPDDDAAFEAYTAKIQGYEVPYLQQRQDKANMNRVILHNDPVDHPTKPENAPAQTQAPPDSPPSN
ncbi:MAG TPA: hypothetical protein VGH02_06605 [Rhizomicrobium sp.]|jgi:hypothetical protein